jgi:hypothetical protein
MYTFVFAARHQMLEKEKRKEAATAKRCNTRMARGGGTISRYKYAQGSSGKTKSPKRRATKHTHL